VDLPEPEAPMIATRSPRATSISMPLKTSTEYFPWVKVFASLRQASTVSLITQCLRRFDASGGPARIKSCQESQHDRNAADGPDVGPAQVRRQLTDQIDVLGQELHLQHAFDEGHDDINIERHQYTAGHAERSADQSDQRTL